MKFFSHKYWLLLLSAMSFSFSALGVFTKLQILERFNSKLGKMQKIALIGDTHLPVRILVNSQVQAVKELLAQLNERSIVIVEDVYDTKIAQNLTQFNSYGNPNAEQPCSLTGLCLYAQAANVKPLVINPEYRFLAAMIFPTLKESLVESQNILFDQITAQSFGKERLNFFEQLEDQLDEFEKILAQNDLSERKKADIEILRQQYEQLFAQKQILAFFQMLAQVSKPLREFIKADVKPEHQKYFCNLMSEGDARFLDPYVVSIIEEQLSADKEVCYVFMGNNHTNNIAEILEKMGFSKVAEIGKRNEISAENRTTKAMIEAKEIATLEQVKLHFKISDFSLLEPNAIAQLANLDQFITQVKNQNNNNSANSQ